MTATGDPPVGPDALPQVVKRPAGMPDHDYVAMLRRKGPVVVDRHGFYWVFSHEHMLACADPETTRQIETEKVRAMGIGAGPIYDYFANSLLFSNGEVHRRRRRPLAKAFAFRLMDAMRPRIREVAEALIRPHLGGGTCDFLGQVAGPLPARIVAEILGLRAADVPRFSDMVYAAMRALSLREAEDLDRDAVGLARLDAYVSALLADRRARPQDDFLSRYVADADADLSPDEVRVQITSVILAGSDTTRMALCSTLSQLLQHPAQWAAFAANPERLKAGAAAEGLRFDPVIGSLPRVATAEITLGGARIPSGTVLSPVVLAALRDPEVYADPGRFDIHRTDHPRYHPVFGAGAHRCLGEALARAELEEALAALATLAPGARLVGPPPTLRGVSGARTIDAMRVSFAPPGASRDSLEPHRPSAC